MKIAYVCADPGVPIFGSKGASIHVRELIRAFVKMGAGLELFAARTDGQPSPELAGVSVHPIRQDHGGDPNPVIRRLLEKSGPFDLVYERYSLWSTTAMEYAAGLDVPGIVEVNSPLIIEHRRYRGPLDLRRAQECAARVFACARLVVAVSGAVARWVESVAGRDCPVTILPNGVDTERFRPNSRSSRNGTFTIGFAGSLKPWHGVDTMLEAGALLLAQDSSYRFLVVGGGPEYERLEAKAEELGIRWAVELTGPVDHATVPLHLGRMDLATAPYPDLPDFYFSPLKLFEYLAAGVPVVASRVGQVAEIVEDGVSGVLCPPGDHQALADAIFELRRAPDRRQALGEAGRALAVRRHTWDRVASAIFREAGLQRLSTEVV